MTDAVIRAPASSSETTRFSSTQTKIDGIPALRLQYEARPIDPADTPDTLGAPRELDLTIVNRNRATSVILTAMGPKDPDALLSEPLTPSEERYWTWESGTPPLGRCNISTLRQMECCKCANPKAYEQLIEWRCWEEDDEEEDVVDRDIADLAASWPRLETLILGRAIVLLLTLRAGIIDTSPGSPGRTVNRFSPAIPSSISRSSLVCLSDLFKDLALIPRVAFTLANSILYELSFTTDYHAIVLGYV
ncbi:hypothetical protein B0H13DRAFT_1936679 [Mycena leptocephala]|nr:hypothetical protein B0H13DRAFT_1936679 [Mycena leptocephala]